MLFTIVICLLFYTSIESIFFSNDFVVDIHLHDTYFVFDLLPLAIIIFLFFWLVISTLYSFFRKYFNVISNSLYLLMLNITSVTALYFGVLMYFLLKNERVIYPPLSNLEVSADYSSTMPNNYPTLFSFDSNLLLFGLFTIAGIGFLYAIYFCVRWRNWCKG